MEHEPRRRAARPPGAAPPPTRPKPLRATAMCALAALSVRCASPPTAASDAGAIDSAALDVAVGDRGAASEVVDAGAMTSSDLPSPADAPPARDAPPPSAWVRFFDASFLTTPTALSVASDGAVCVAGDFQGDLRVMGRSVTSSGASDGFTACFDPGGALLHLFATRAPGDDAITAAAMASDSLVVAGHLPGVAQLGGAQVGRSGDVEVFVLRIDRGGAVTRAVSFGGPGTDQPSAIAVGPNGHIFVAGSSDQDLAAGTVSLRSGGRGHAWIIELDESLTPRQGRSFTAGFDVQSAALRVSRDGAITLGGSFSGSLSLDGDTLGPTLAQDVFVLRLDPGLRTVWARRHGGGGDDRLHDLAVSDSGEVTLAGSSGIGRVRFGGDEFAVVGASDGWLARLDARGEARWLRRVGGEADDRALSLFVDARGGVAAGRFDRELALGASSLAARGASDAWRARFDDDGALSGAIQYGGTGPDLATRVVAAPGGSVTVGTFAARAEVAGQTIETVGIAGAFVHRAVE